MKLWRSAEDLYRQILECRFVKGLADGSLGQIAFAHYLSQDVEYLRQDNRALEILVRRAERDDFRNFFRTLVVEGIAMEQALHDEYLAYFGVKEAGNPSPVFGAYEAFILDQAGRAPFPVAVAALLPCFWIYACVGGEILRTSSPENKYAKFIETYAGEGFEQYVRQFVSLTDELGRNAGSDLQEEMIRVFVRATKYELEVFEESAEKEN